MKAVVAINRFAIEDDIGTNIESERVSHMVFLGEEGSRYREIKCKNSVVAACLSVLKEQKDVLNYQCRVNESR